MTDLHPHWHATGDEDAAPAAIPVTVNTGASSKVSIQAASRMPGAFVGILIFGVIGFTLAGGWQAIDMSWLAQVGGATSSSASSTSITTPIEVHISTSDGFQPLVVTVKPGQKITWINDQSIPHILTSQTLRDGSGKYLNTPAIFPGGRATFTVGAKEPDRQHTVTSTTDTALVGTVMVSASGLPVAAGSSSSKTQPLGSLDGVNLPTGGQGTTASSAPGGTLASFSSASSLSSTAAPVGSIVDPTAPDQLVPEDPTVPADDVFAPSTPQPIEAPNTGPGLWAAILSSIAVLALVVKKYFVRMA